MLLVIISGRMFFCFEAGVGKVVCLESAESCWAAGLGLLKRFWLFGVQQAASLWQKLCCMSALLCKQHTYTVLCLGMD